MKTKHKTQKYRNSLLNINNNNLCKEKFNEIYNKHLLFKISEKKNKLLNEFENEINSKLKTIENKKNYSGKKIVYEQLEKVFENVEKIKKNLTSRSIKRFIGLENNSKQIFNSLFGKILKKELKLFLYKMFKYLNFQIKVFYLRTICTINFEFIHNKYLDIRKESILQIYNNNNL